mmetsp:Transcript_13497/g.22986  ORF Transcript_13497/g.22986 Transcript_13497/m.22986 type:complete len:105 (+) Transcript_13497:535-849(+)
MKYNRFVKTSYDEFIKPTMKYADIIIPHGRSNTVAIDFVVSNLKNRVLIDGFTVQSGQGTPEKLGQEDDRSGKIQLDETFNEKLGLSDSLISQELKTLTDPVQI